MLSSALDVAVHLGVLALATNQVVETYRHGKIFAGVRARVELSRWNFLQELTGCAFCFSHWIAGLLVIWWVLSFLFIGYDGWQPLAVVFWRAPIYWLAVSRGSQLLNDWWYSFSRTPKPEDAFGEPTIGEPDDYPPVEFPEEENES